mgnify:CR=1 FL=1
MRRYIVSPVTGVVVAAVVAAGSAIMGSKPGKYRIGFVNGEGEVTLLRDIRAQLVLVGLGLNLLPWIAGKVAFMQPLTGLPVIGSERVQDYAGLVGATALISLFSSEGMDMLETGQFFGLPVPQKLVDMFRGVGEVASPGAQDALPGPTTTSEETPLAVA